MQKKGQKKFFSTKPSKLRKILIIPTLTGLMLVSPIIGISPDKSASASYMPRPQRTRGNSPPPSTQSSRGCQKALPTLWLIGPSIKEPVGKTARTQPIFYVYLPSVGEPVSLRFSITNESETLIDRTLVVSPNSSLFPLDLDKTLSLADGNYTLTIGIVCEPKRPWDSAYLQVRFQKVSLDDSFTKELAAASPQERPLLLSREGIGYDAIAESAGNTKLLTEILKQMQVSLPSQLD